MAVPTSHAQGEKKCSERKAVLSNQLSIANHCITDSECTRVYLIQHSCQFGCETLVNRSEADRLAQQVEEFEKDCPMPCDYKCPAEKATAPVCRAGKCEVLGR